jgi:signal transduction histidine kinase
MQYDTVDLGGVLENCGRRFERQAKERGVDLRLEPAALPALDGDERRLEQVFNNLIDNAVRHTPEGGKVTVHAGARNGHVRVAVQNSGSYIAAGDLERVFERFFQLDRNRSRTTGGAGLGLAIAKEVVHAHRGEISASSDRKQGTEFVVTLPITVPSGNGETKESGS